MPVLVLDSCGAGCAAGLWHDGRLTAYRSEAMQRGQDARLVPMAQAVMAEAGCDFASLDCVAVTRGPGSFTGLRVGLAAALGFGLAAGRPVIGLDRFSLYRHMHPAGDVMIVLDSRRADPFCRFYPVGGPPHDAACMTADAIDRFAAGHPGMTRIGDAAGAADYPAELLLTGLGALAARADPDDPLFAPHPLYLRTPDVTVAGSAVQSASRR